MSARAPMHLAVFDLDGTLTTRDCVVPFLTRLQGGGRARLGLSLLRRPMALLSAVARRDRDALKACATRAVFAGRAVADIEAEAEPFATSVARDWLHPDMVEHLNAHRDRGHDVMIVSASYAVYVRPLAQRLGLDPADVAATEIEVAADGRATGHLVGPNCRGVEKVRRVERWLEARGSERAAVTIWAYGDSAGDRELLAMADTAWLRGTGGLPALVAADVVAVDAAADHDGADHHDADGGAAS